MWPTSIDDGILHELSDIRNPSGKVISTSLLDLSKIGDRFHLSDHRVYWITL